MRFIIKLAATVVAGSLLAGCGGEDFTGSYRAKNGLSRDWWTGS